MHHRGNGRESMSLGPENPPAMPAISVHRSAFFAATSSSRAALLRLFRTYSLKCMYKHLSSSLKALILLALSVRPPAVCSMSGVPWPFFPVDFSDFPSVRPARVGSLSGPARDKNEARRQRHSHSERFDGARGDPRAAIQPLDRLNTPVCTVGVTAPRNKASSQRASQAVHRARAHASIPGIASSAVPPAPYGGLEPLVCLCLCLCPCLSTCLKHRPEWQQAGDAIH